MVFLQDFKDSDGKAAPLWKILYDYGAKISREEASEDMEEREVSQALKGFDENSCTTARPPSVENEPVSNPYTCGHCHKPGHKQGKMS